MGINIADNFAYNGKKPLDNRTEYTTLSAMKSVADANINEGCLAYNKEDGKYYKFLSTNTVDATTGKWREFETGGGGGGQTYNDFTGATSSTAGAHGLVPAPSAGDEGKVLFGNGLWGALPSVDLSVLSNEAFQLTTTEKAIGTYTDGKILYGKVVDMGELPNNTTKSVSAGVSNVDTVSLCYLTITYQSSNTNLTFMTVGMPDNLNIHETVEYRNGNINFNTTIDRRGCYGKCTIFYTKTTDSPLPSDVKFAGVTSSGEVIYEKTVETTSPSSANTWTVIADLGVNNVICEAVGNIYPSGGSIGARSISFMNAIAYSMNYSKNGELALFVNEGGYTNKPVIVKIRYTLVS